MTYWLKAFGLTVDTGGWAGAGEAGAVSLGVGALKPMVFGQVVTGAKWADDGVFGAPTELYSVAKGMASVTLSNKGKRVKEFDSTRCAEEKNGLRYEAFKPRPIFIKEGEEDR